MKKALTVIGVALHAVSCVLFVLFEQILFTRPSVFLFGILAMILSFIVYYAEAAWSFNERTNAFNILKLVYVLLSVVFVMAFAVVLFSANDKLEVFNCCFTVYYLLLFVMQIISLLRKNYKGYNKECAE